MRKVVIPSAGGYERLLLQEHPDPTPAPGELLIDVDAIGVNYADCVVRMGFYRSAQVFVGWPITPGFEFAGRVASAGDPALPPGTAVLGVTRFGAYATRLCAPRHQLWPIPPGLTPQQAAAFPAVHLTAHYALHELAHPHPGDTLLVHSAAGGVGSALVQLGKRAGCRVVAVVGRAHKVEAARALGADEVIDKSRGDLWTQARRLAPQGYQVILDANGVSTLGDSYRHLARPGKLVVYGFHSMLPRRGGKVGAAGYLRLAWDYLRTPRFSPLDLCDQNRGVLAFNLSYLFEQRELLDRSMTQLLGYLAEGALQPPAVTAYPLSQVAQAHAALESGDTIGKLVLVPDAR